MILQFLNVHSILGSNPHIKSIKIKTFYLGSHQNQQNSKFDNISKIKHLDKRIFTSKKFINVHNLKLRNWPKMKRGQK